MGIGKFAPPNLWSSDKTQSKQQTTAHERSLSRVVGVALPLLLLLAAGAGVTLPATLPPAARVALFAFACAVIFWSTTNLNAAYVALGATLLLVLAGGSPQERLFQALAADVVWLMIGAFILGGAVQQTGLAARLTELIVARARNVRQVCWLLTAALIPLTFLIPSTSGRAAVALPVFHSLSGAANDRRITRALALLIPTVILVATISTLVGAGSHLVANDLLRQLAGRSISFAEWTLYGLPFGIVAGFISCQAVLWLFLDRETRQRPIAVQRAERRKFSRAEWMTLGVTVLMVTLWATEHWHGYEIATVSIFGALLLTLPGVGVMKWKDAMNAISWNLVLFVGAALVLGQALIETRAAQWIIEQLFTASGIAQTQSSLWLLLLLAMLSLTSHIYMTSHTARAAALVPPLLYLASTLQLNPVAVMFIGTVGMNYCLTFPVSSKALLMFQELETETYQPADLLRLSAVLLLAHLALVLVFYYGYWRWIGLALRTI